MRSLSIVIPAYNESARLPATLRQVLSYLDRSSLDFAEVIVVDDGSRDNTALIVESFAASSCIRLVSYQPNRGKGYAVRQGMLDAIGDWILFSDADLSAPIEELDKLMEVAQRTGAAVVAGSRAVNRKLVEKRQNPIRECAGRAFNIVSRSLTGLKLQDSQCGFKLYRRDAARAIFCRQRLDGFAFDVEDLVIAGRLGYTVEEAPVRWKNAEGTKVTAMAGVKSFTDLVNIWWHGARGAYSQKTAVEPVDTASRRRSSGDVTRAIKTAESKQS